VVSCTRNRTMHALESDENILSCVSKHYRKERLRQRLQVVGLARKYRRVSLTRRLFSDAVGSGAVGIIVRQARSKGRRVSFCHRRRLTRRPKNALGSGKAVRSGHFRFSFKKSNF
jgi:hypothetical protein